MVRALGRLPQIRLNALDNTGSGGMRETGIVEPHVPNGLCANADAAASTRLARHLSGGLRNSASKPRVWGLMRS
jgi:hypothetical protein